MNEIRNGTFERGDDKFWEIIGTGTLTISDSAPKHGTYHAEVYVASPNVVVLLASDYISVEFGQLLHVSYYITRDVQTEYATRFYEYDGALNLIKTTDRDHGYAPASYGKVCDMIKPAIGTEYIRVGVRLHDEEANNTASIDTCCAELIEGGSGQVYQLEALRVENKVAGGDSSATPLDMTGFTTYHADLDAGTVNGTNPTVDVDVCEKDCYDNERVLGSFTQLDAAGDERIDISPPLYDELYVKYTEGGAWSDVDLRVTVTGRR